MQKIKVLFMGTPDYATTILDYLVKQKNIKIVGLYTQEDKPVGRKQIITFPHIKKYILDNKLNIPIFQPKTLKDEKVIQMIKELNPDFIIVAAYGQILPKGILQIAPCINLHASLLPKYRGASPIQEAILNQEEYSGVTAMKMDEGLDTGDILAKNYIKIIDMDAPTLFEKLSHMAGKLTIKVINSFDEILPIKQNETIATYCKKIKKSDGLIDLEDAKEIYTKYLAYKYWPGIYLQSGLKLKKIELIDDTSYDKSKKGKILSIKDKYIIVGCSKGSLKIYTLQAPSKKQLNAVEYLKGKRLKCGDYLL